MERKSVWLFKFGFFQCLSCIDVTQLVKQQIFNAVFFSFRMIVISPAEHNLYSIGTISNKLYYYITVCYIQDTHDFTDKFINYTDNNNKNYSMY